MKFINQADLYQLIIDIIEDKAKSEDTYAYMISPLFGISQSAYYDIKRSLKNKTTLTDNLLSNAKMRTVCNKLEINLKDVFFLLND